MDTINNHESLYVRSLIEASLDPLVAISIEGKITDMNEALAVMTGISREELIGTDFFEYFTDQQKARAVYQEVFEKAHDAICSIPIVNEGDNGRCFIDGDVL